MNTFRWTLVVNNRKSQSDFNPGHKSNPHIKLRDDGQRKGLDFVAQRFRSN